MSLCGYVNMCLRIHMKMCIHVCGCQLSMLDISPHFLLHYFFERGSFTEPGIVMARQAPEICLFWHPITGNIRCILPQPDYEWTEALNSGPYASVTGTLLTKSSLSLKESIFFNLF